MSKMTFLSNAMRVPVLKELWLQLCVMRLAGSRADPPSRTISVMLHVPPAELVGYYSAMIHVPAAELVNFCKAYVSESPVFGAQ